MNAKKNRPFSFLLSTWKRYIITLCLNATQSNKRQDDESDDLNLD